MTPAAVFTQCLPCFHDDTAASTTTNIIVETSLLKSWANTVCWARSLLSCISLLLPPATKLGQGYIFTGVCDSVHRGGGVCSRGVWSGWGVLSGGCLLPGRGVPSRGVPGRDPIGTATAWGGTHPTGMHSCFVVVFHEYRENLRCRIFHTDFTLFPSLFSCKLLAKWNVFPHWKWCAENIPFIFNHVAEESFNLAFYTIFKSQSHPQTALD